MKALLCLLTATVGLAGCRRDAPPEPAAAAPEPTAAEPTAAEAEPTAAKPAEAEPPLCERAYDNVLRIEEASGAAHQTINRLKRTRGDFIEHCQGSPPVVQRCLAEATDRKTLAACAFEREGARPPRPELRARCEQVHTRMVEILTRERAPESVLERMADRRGEAITECTREPDAVIACLQAATSSTDIRSCRTAEQGAPTPPDPKLQADCRAIHARLLGEQAPADVPARFRDRWKTRGDLFVEECARMTPPEVACMSVAAAFEDYRACIQPPEAP